MIVLANRRGARHIGRLSLLSGVLLVGLTGLAAPNAMAECSDNNPPDGATVVCSGPVVDVVGVEGNNAITVEVLDGATIVPAGLQVEGVDLNDDAIILVRQGGLIDTTANLADALNVRSGADITIDGTLNGFRGIGFRDPITTPVGFSNSTIHVGTTGQILTTGIVGYGLDGGGGGNVYQIDGLVETSGNGAVGIDPGEGDNITVGATGRIRTLFQTAMSDAIAGFGTDAITVSVADGGLIETFGTGSGAISLGSNASVTLNGAVRTHRDLAVGVRVSAGSSVVIGPLGEITTGGDPDFPGEGFLAHGIQTSEFGPSAGSVVQIDGVVRTDGLIAHGVSAGENDTIRIGETGRIITNGAVSNGIFVNGDGTSGTDSVEIEIAGTIEANGGGSAIFLQQDLNTPDLNALIDISETGRLFAQSAAVIEDPFGGPAVNTTVRIAGEVARVSSADVAINLTEGNDRLELLPEFSIVGITDVGNGFDTFVLDGAAGTTGMLDLTDIATRFLGFDEAVKTGDGIWILTDATQSFVVDALVVDAGTLQLDGMLGGTDVTVGAGGMLTGSGTVGGALTIMGGGSHAPGGSIGIQMVEGDYRLDSGGVLVIEVDELGAGDQVVVAGTVTIDGADLTIQETPGTYTDTPLVYTIVENTGQDAVAGAGFDTVTNQLAFLDATVDLAGGDGNDVTLTLTRNATDFILEARSFNQRSVAAGLDAVGFDADGALGDAIGFILGSNADGARAAFDALSGEIHPTAAGLALGQVGRIANVMRAGGQGQAAGSGLSGAGQFALGADLPALSTSLASIAGRESPMAPTHIGERAVWVRPFGDFGSVDADGNAHATDWQGGGVAIGFDQRVNDGLTVGLAGGYSRVTGDADAVASDVDTDLLAIAATGRLSSGAWSAGAALGYAHLQFDTTRGLASSGLPATAAAEYDANGLFASALVSRIVDLDGVALRPFAGVDAVWLDVDGFTETGAGTAGLTSAGRTYNSAVTRIGLAVAAEVAWDDVLIMPRARAAWAHEWADDLPELDLAFVGGAATFPIRGAPRNRDWAELAAGLGVGLGDGVSGFFDYTASVGRQATAHAFTGGLRITW
ncbi:MAG: autotransporter domain-containing protein [Pseudomonadota bacterium]